MIAVNQLLRALESFDGDLRLPQGIDERHLRILRNYLEHWDDTDGRAHTASSRGTPCGASLSWLLGRSSGFRCRKSLTHWPSCRWTGPRRNGSGGR